MPSKKALEAKKEIVSEIEEKLALAKSIVLFDYRGLTDEVIKELRNKLRENDSNYKVYKNTLMNRAFHDLDIKLDESLNGPSALAFSSDQIAPIKVLSEFAKTHPALVLKVGIVDGEISDEAKLSQLATIPSREGLLTMLAGAMIAIPRDLSICLDLYGKQKEGE